MRSEAVTYGRREDVRPKELREPEGIRENPRKPKGTRRNPKEPEEIRGNPKEPEEIRGNPRKPEGTRRNPMEPEGTRKNPKEPEGTRRNPKKPQGTRRNPKEPEGTRGDHYSGIFKRASKPWKKTQFNYDFEKTSCALTLHDKSEILLDSPRQERISPRLSTTREKLP
ncbi:uncharacterized protein LOC134775339 [Penaeus indicus]|uniref:uncharacterized protein LOC134775339 n=1 Tax=Penaeus indicus TaxID=29960 RepID=UPI00300CE9F4